MQEVAQTMNKIPPLPVHRTTGRAVQTDGAQCQTTWRAILRTTELFEASSSTLAQTIPIFVPQTRPESITASTQTQETWRLDYEVTSTFNTVFHFKNVTCYMFTCISPKISYKSGNTN